MRVRRVVAGVAVVALAVVGCSSEPQSGELDLEGDDAAAAPAEPDPSVEVSEEPSEPSEPPEPPEDEQLYPPLPPLEPDPDSDVPIEDQEFFLELHAHLYEKTQRAMATNDTVGLDQVLTGQLLEDILRSVEAQADQGVVSLWPDGSVEYVRVESAGNGPAEVVECARFGPETGIYDAESGELIDGGREGALVIRTYYEIVNIDDELVYRAVDASSQHEENCDAALD